MKHLTTINGHVLYELEPETPDDRHIIEILKGKNKVAMRQSSKGGIIFACEADSPAVVEKSPDEPSPTDLSGIQAKGAKS